MHRTAYKFIGFGDIDGPKPYKFTRFLGGGLVPAGGSSTQRSNNFYSKTAASESVAFGGVEAAVCLPKTHGHKWGGEAPPPAHVGFLGRETAALIPKSSISGADF